MKQPKRLGFVAVLTIGLLTCGAAGLLGQLTEGTIVGTVADNSGAAVTGAKVTVKNVGTGFTVVQTTDSIGYYRVPHLAPGHFRVSVEAQGFKTAIVEDAVINVNVVTRVDTTLEVGSLNQTVTVSEAAPVIQTEEGRLAETISSREVQELPLNGREVYQLATLEPGVTATAAPVISNVPSPTSSDTFNFGFIANGSTPRGNDFRLDGSNNNNEWLGGMPLIFPSIDAIQELQIQTLNFSAEYGRNNGAVVNVVTKSGTNDLHGTAFYFHRNTALNARNFFDVPQSGKTPVLQHQFGFSLGGPIIKDKTFFFVDYEGSRLKNGAPILLTSETPEFRNLVITTLPNNVAARFFHDFPGPPCLPGTSLDVGSIPDPTMGPFAVGPKDGIPDVCTAAAPQIARSQSDQYLIRGDERFTSHDYLFVRWIGTLASADVSRDEVFSAATRGFKAPLDGFFADLGIGFTHQFSTATLNDLRLGYSRNNGKIDFRVPNSPTADILKNAGMPNAFADLFMDDGVASFGGVVYIPRKFVFNTYTVNDTLTHQAGRHALKTGFELRRIQENSNYLLGTSPFYEFNSVFNLANDQPYFRYALIGRNPASPDFGKFTDTPRHFRWTQWGLFVEDDWKTTPKLTLNLGLRYDVFGTPSETNGILNNITLGPGNDVFSRIASGSVGHVKQLWNTDYKDFAPRLGLAWDPTGKGKMAIRSGFSIAYLEPYSNLFTNATRFDPPNAVFVDLLTTSGNNMNYTFPFQPSPNDAAPVSPHGGIVGNRIQPSGFPSDLRSAYSTQWFLGVQRELLSGYVFSINYVGTRGLRMYTREDYNRFPGDICNATTCDFTLNRLNPEWGQIFFISNEASSTYHGLNAQLRKSYNHGFMLVSNYTFGKVLDNVTEGGLGDYFNTNSYGAFYAGVQDIQNPRADRGPSEFDVKHRFTLTGLWNLPSPKGDMAMNKVLGGWQLNTIVSLQSGRPFSVFCTLFWFSGCDFNMDGLRYDRPNRPANLKTGGFSESEFVNGVFKVTDFCPNGLVPFFLGTPCVPVGTDGNLGRNVFRGPSLKTVDLAVLKNTKVRERVTVQFRAETFNLFNRVNLYDPEGDLGNPRFGKSSAAFPSRQIQFGLKFLF